MAVHYVEIRLTPNSARPELTAYISDAWVVAARDEALRVGRPDCVAFGDIVLAAILAVMWVCAVPRAYAGAVQVNGEGSFQWRYHLDCAREEVCQVCGETWDIRFLSQGVCVTCRSVMPLTWME
jgi:hypothetical protein